MVATTEKMSTYLEIFEQAAGRRSGEPGWLSERRALALAKFTELGLPTRKQEEYRYTDLSVLAKTDFRAAPDESAPGAHGAISLDDLAPWLFDEVTGTRLVFVDGRYAPHLSDTGDGAEGVIVQSLSEAFRSHAADTEMALDRRVAESDQVLAELNTALFGDGALVRIPDRVIASKPVHLLFLSLAREPDTVSHPRVLILAGRDSQASVIETHAGLGSRMYWSNGVTEIVAAANARVDHYRLQQESSQAIHTSLVEMRQERDSNVTTHSIALGGLLVRNDVEAVLMGQGAECTMNGLYAVKGRQHVDNRTCVDHREPHCSSHQLYKGVLDERSRGVFNGKIIVREGAQKTDAFQSNKNLLLSENAEIDTKPQLVINANDVKCSHGTTIGQIDEDAVFYLRARGIAEAEARGLLTYAFVADVLEKIRFDVIRERFEAQLMSWLVNGKQSQGGGE